MLVPVFALLLAYRPLVRASWLHGWETSAAMTFADFNSNTLLTDAELGFASSHYRIVSLEKCTGIRSNVTTEHAIWSEAQRFKQRDPTTKVIFYLATDQQGLSCYAANDEFMAHQEWWLRDDRGQVVRSNGHPIMDPTVKDAASWWINISLVGDDGHGNFGGVPVSSLIDGVLADGSNFAFYADISTTRLEALEDAKFRMIGSLQAKFRSLNGGIVMANGIDMYGPPHADPRDPTNHNLRVLGFVDAIMNEHTAVFESVNRNNASFNLETVSQDLDAIVAASKMENGTKLVFVQTWPGMYVSTKFWPDKSGPASCYPPVSAGGEPTPQNNSQWREALRKHFSFAHALFLSVAEPNTYWFYGGVWYPSNTGIISCPHDPSSCPAPPEWYPDLKRPLGAPRGPRMRIGDYKWRREFEHAAVFVDLRMPQDCNVTFF